MKFRVIIPIITLVSLLVWVVASVGCDSGSCSGSNSVAKDVPDGVDQFTFIDVDVLRNDDDLEDLYESMEDEYGNVLEEFEIDFDDVDSLATFGDSIVVYGEFDLDDIRDRLDDLNYNDDEYKNTEVWDSDGLWEEYFALVGEDLIILGSEDDVRDCIKVIKEDNESLSDDQDYKAVMDRLPTGIVIMYSTDEDYQDLEASGISINKEDDDTLKYTGILKFEDEDAADDAMDEIEDDIREEDNDFKNIDVDIDGEFVIVTAEIDIDDVFGEEDDYPWETELRDVQTAVTAMMVASGVGKVDGWIEVSDMDLIGVDTNEDGIYDYKASDYLVGLNADGTVRSGALYTVSVYGVVTQTIP